MIESISKLSMEDIDFVEDYLDVSLYDNFLGVKVVQENKECLVNLSKGSAKVLRDWLSDNIDSMEEYNEE